jgi:hypothetical protein
MMDSDFIRRVGVCLAKLHVSFSHLACSQAAAMVWAEAFDGLKINDIEQACREYIRGETKTPTPAHIRRIAIGNAKAAKRLASAVRVGGVTYFTNPPDLEREKANREAGLRYLEKQRQKKSAEALLVREPSAAEIAEMNARKERSIAALRELARRASE